MLRRIEAPVKAAPQTRLNVARDTMRLAQRASRSVRLLATVVVAVLFCVPLLGIRHRQTAPTAATNTTVFDFDRIGHPLPSLNIETVDGEPLSLASTGQPTYVFLFASWCAPCIESLPIIRRAHATYGNRVRFVAIDVLENRAALRALLAREALPFDVGIVEKSEIDAVVSDNARENGGSKFLIPADYLLDSQGIVRDVWHGVAVSRDGTLIDELTPKLSKLAASATITK